MSFIDNPSSHPTSLPTMPATRTWVISSMSCSTLSRWCSSSARCWCTNPQPAFLISPMCCLA
jgi:hypothetical protein